MAVNRIRKYHLKQLSKKHLPSGEYPGMPAVAKIALVFTEGEDRGAIDAFVTKMKELGKEVSLLSYHPRKRKELEVPPPHLHFCSNEVNWYGKPVAEDVKDFLKPVYDVCIALPYPEGSPLEFILAEVRAAFTIGVSPSQKNPFDLLLRANDRDKLSKTFDEIIYYLNFINQTR